MQRATATAFAAAPTTGSPARRPLLPLPLSVASAAAAESAFAKVCARPPARRSPLPREIESRRRRRLTAPRAANRPAWPRRTAASAEGEEARQRRRPPNENQAKRRRRARSGPVGSNRGLFCQCSLVHEAGKSWCQEKKEIETEERKSSSSGRGSGRGLRCGSDTANDTYISFLHGDSLFLPANQ